MLSQKLSILFVFSILRKLDLAFRFFKSLYLLTDKIKYLSVGRAAVIFLEPTTAILILASARFTIVRNSILTLSILTT